MRPFTRQSLAAMSKEAQELMIQAVADLGKKAVEYAYQQGYRKYPRRGKEARAISANYRDWLIANGKDPNLAWDDITGNLRDSIGSAVYVNGVLREDAIRYLEDTPKSKKTDPRYGRGREALLNYFRRVHPKSSKNEVYLLVAAAMPYANAFERGTHAGGYEIKVISGARDYIDAHWHEIESKVYAKMGLRKPASRIKRGDVKLYNDAGYER